MKVLIFGAGRMGIRHLQGAISIKEVSEVFVLDIKSEVIEAASKTFADNKKVKFGLFKDFSTNSKFDYGIIASTAGDRIELCKLAYVAGCKNLMIEKPLGQSYNQVVELCEYLSTVPEMETVVNLNMRMYDTFIKLKKDINSLSQFDGEKIFTINTGTIGIGCNGIHYLDLIYFLLDANRSEIVAADIDDTLIPSGRGADFGDFGGSAVIKYYNNRKYLGKAMLSLASGSAVFGSWDIVGSFGKIMVDEISQKRINWLRKEDSQMPVSRYAADFLQPTEEPFASPFLGDLTARWIENLLIGKNTLPNIKESLPVHKLMFDWLSRSRIYKDTFPIT